MTACDRIQKCPTGFWFREVVGSGIFTLVGRNTIWAAIWAAEDELEPMPTNDDRSKPSRSLVAR